MALSVQTSLLAVFDPGARWHLPEQEVISKVWPGKSLRPGYVIFPIPSTLFFSFLAVF